MLPAFDFSLTFDTSRDYIRCVVLTHIGAACLLFNSNFNALFITLCLLLLLISYINVSKTGSPQQNYRELSYHQTFWLMRYHNQPDERFDSVRIRFNGGFFLLLELLNTTTPKKVIVFNDQISEDKRRRLMVLARIR